MDEFPFELHTDEYQELRINKRVAVEDRSYAESDPNWHDGLIRAQQTVEEYAKQFDDRNPIKDMTDERWRGFNTRHPDAFMFGMSSEFCDYDYATGFLKGALFGLTGASFTGLKLALHNSHSRLYFARWVLLWTIPSSMLWSSYDYAACRARNMDLTMLQNLKKDPRFK